MRLIILVGLPGSGKSTYRDSLKLPYVNQDELGSANKCAEKATEYLKQGLDVIIDRTNIDKYQRSKWIKLAKFHNVTDIECVVFKSDFNNCVKRILKRTDHPTIPQTYSIDKVQQIVRKFLHAYDEPTFDEGFNTIRTIYTDNLLGEKSNTGNGNRHGSGFKSCRDSIARAGKLLRSLLR